MHVRNVSIAAAVLLFIAIPLIRGIDAAVPSSDGAAGRLPSVRQSPATLEGRVAGLKEVNYYPASGGWTYMWTRFDPKSIDRDFGRIRGLGANTVRIIIQPTVFEKVGLTRVRFRP